MLISDIIKMQASVQPYNWAIYTADTWAEWEKDTGVTGDSTGLKWITNGTTLYAHLNTNCKSSTEYGLLYNVVSKTLNNSIGMSGFSIFDLDSNLPSAIGANKSIKTSKEIIEDNRIRFYTSSTEPIGRIIKIKDVRLFELLPNSEIRDDFYVLTAEQLNEKYKY